MSEGEELSNACAQGGDSSMLRPSKSCLNVDLIRGFIYLQNGRPLTRNNVISKDDIQAFKSTINHYKGYKKNYI